MQYLEAGMLQQVIEKLSSILQKLEDSIIKRHRANLSFREEGELGRTMIANLQSFHEVCKKMEFRSSMFNTSLLLERINDEEHVLYDYQLVDHLKHILNGLFIDQNLQSFLRLPHELEDYHYRFVKKIMGENIIIVFPDMEYDLVHAGRCYAIEEYTASVFHLMRVMELAVKELGNKLGVDLIQYQLWNDILLQCNAKLNGKFKTKAEKQSAENIAYRSIVSHLDNVRQAWRNEVMHPAAYYEKWQADGVISTVKSFLVEFTHFLKP